MKRKRNNLTVMEEDTTRVKSKPPLQTRCPNCHTHFNAYDTQLDTYKGEVRCGLCLHIFNAYTHATGTSTTQVKQPAHSKSYRKLLVISTFLFSGALIIASSIFWRNAIIKQFPSSVTVLGPICRILSCTLPAVENIDAWEITHSELRQGTETNSYLLQTVLQNDASFTVALPAIEITLNNALNQRILHRVLQPRDYLPRKYTSLSRTGLQKNTDLAIEIPLKTSEAAVRYYLSLLYP